MPSESHSITAWIDRLRSSDPEAARRLWERFFARMVEVARQRLSQPRGLADEEDVALSAFLCFHRGVQAGRFPHLRDRGELWDLLFTLTTRKAIDLVRREDRLKRGGAAGVEALGEGQEPADAGPTPAEAAAMQDELARLLNALADEQLRQIALARMEGHTNAEIARQLGCAAPTVERRLRRVRLTWELLRREEGGEKSGAG
jgi:RNA polymerase sigma factor (sigma-70 family)